MRWKEFPYWLKGGLIGLSTITLVFILSLAFDLLAGMPPFRGEFSMFFFVVAALPFVYAFLSLFSMVFPELVKSSDVLFTLVFWFVSAGLGYFLVGAFIGWIVGRLKRAK